MCPWTCWLAPPLSLPLAERSPLPDRSLRRSQIAHGLAESLYVSGIPAWRYRGPKKLIAACKADRDWATVSRCLSADQTRLLPPPLPPPPGFSACGSQLTSGRWNSATSVIVTISSHKGRFPRFCLLFPR